MREIGHGGRKSCESTVFGFSPCMNRQSAAGQVLLKPAYVATFSYHLAQQMQGLRSLEALGGNRPIMYKYTYKYQYTHIHIYIYIHLYVCIHRCMYVYIYIYIYI